MSKKQRVNQYIIKYSIPNIRGEHFKFFTFFTITMSDIGTAEDTYMTVCDKIIVDLKVRENIVAKREDINMEMFSLIDTYFTS